MTHFEILSDKIEKKSVSIGIIGLGYVGLPLALLFAENGFLTTGFDIEPAKIDRLKVGQSYIEHISSASIQSVVDLGVLKATTNLEYLTDLNILIMCLPTPLTAKKEPDLSFVKRTSRTIAKHLKTGQLIILESTTYPGTTSEIVQPILESSGMIAGQDFFLAYSPEREDPGNLKFHTRTIPKIIGADDENSLHLAHQVYGSVVDTIVPVANTKTAEAVKIMENVFRSVNIALVNELKMIFDKMEIDVWEVIRGASTKPFGFMPFYPGPGLGGHCVPIDPFYLSWKARQSGIRTRFIELAGEINTNMPIYVINKLKQALGTQLSKSLEGSHILVVGVAYKKNSDDTRESPALMIIKLLEERGSSTAFHDPVVKEIPKTRGHSTIAGKHSKDLSATMLSSFDAVLICTDHDDIDYNFIASHSQLVIDTRNALAGVDDRSKIVNA